MSLINSIYLNFLFTIVLLSQMLLFFVSFVPYATGLISTYATSTDSEELAIIICASVILLIGLNLVCLPVCVCVCVCVCGGGGLSLLTVYVFIDVDRASCLKELMSMAVKVLTTTSVSVCPRLLLMGLRLVRK